jgi:hypothetical protein
MSRNVTQTRCKLAIDVPNSKTPPQNPIGKYIAKLTAHSLIVDLIFPKVMLRTPWIRHQAHVLIWLFPPFPKDDLDSKNNICISDNQLRPKL